MNRTSEIAKKRYSFKKAYGMVPISLAKTVKAELMAALNIRHPGSWRNALSNGYISPSLDSFVAVSEIFKKYNISEAWEVVSHE